MNKAHFEKLEELDYRSNEAYKTLRTNLLFSGLENKVICFSSCAPGEGKSSVAFHLAKSLSEDGKKVVLIDADLRKSAMVIRYRIPGISTGLSYYLSGQCKLEEAVCTTDFKDFDLIVAGKVPPNPSELLGNERFDEMLKVFREKYDYVLIDTPPIGSVIDAAVVAKKCDGAILVIASNEVSRRFAMDAKGQLERTGCRILGVVLNKVKLSKNSYYGKYYGKYYGNYGNEKK